MDKWINHFLNLRSRLSVISMSGLDVCQKRQNRGTRKVDHHQDFLEIYVQSEQTVSCGGVGKYLGGM